MAVAAQSALPGDALYPLKRAIENAQTGFSTDEADKGSHLLANASGRLDEVSELSREGDLKDNVAIASTLNTFTEQATEASDLLLADYANTGDESSIEELRDFTSSSMAQLGDLEDAVPPGARDELIHAARVLSQIDSAAASACPTCAGGITELPTILTSSSTIGDLGAAAETATQNGGKNGGKGEQGEVVLPNTGGSLPPGSVLSPSTGGSTSTSGTPSTPNQPRNPLGDLTDGLLGGGDSQQTSNNPPAIPGLPLPDVEETLDELTDPLLGN